MLIEGIFYRPAILKPRPCRDEVIRAIGLLAPRGLLMESGETEPHADIEIACGVGIAGFALDLSQ